MFITMGFAFAGERNPCVDAPRRVIGFDLSARAENSGLAADSDENNNDCKHPCSARPTVSKSTSPSASSPRSALQQLLLPEIAIADPTAFLSAADDGIRLSYEPASSQAPKQKTFHALSSRSRSGLCTQRHWDAKDLHLPEESNEIVSPEKAMKRKKSSLFILPATSLVAETSHQCSHKQEADHQGKSRGINMEFLNACHLCKRRLGQGRDLFMYSGDKAFCSTECRDHQIVTDQRRERCTPPIIRAGASATFRSYMASNTSNAVIKQTRATSSIKSISINKHNVMNHAAAA